MEPSLELLDYYTEEPIREFIMVDAFGKVIRPGDFVEMYFDTERAFVCEVEKKASKAGFIFVREPIIGTNRFHSHVWRGREVRKLTQEEVTMRILQS